MASIWNPWRGCHRYSDGCKYCYIHKGDSKKNINTNEIIKTKDFDKPIQKLKNGNYKMKSGLVYVCFQSDFLLEDTDSWRMDCYNMIKERSDCDFLFLTKRIERFNKVLPLDWDMGYDNIIVGCTIENQENANYRLNIFKTLPIKHKNIICQPLLEDLDIEKYLDDIELVVVGGESDYNARPLNYEWVLHIKEQCIRKNVKFEFRQAGTHFIKDNKNYYLKTFELMKVARELNIDI